MLDRFAFFAKFHHRASGAMIFNLANLFFKK